MFNVLTAKRAKTRQVPIMWTDDDEERILYPYKDALVISADVVSKRFDQILVDTGSSIDVLSKSTLDEIRISSLTLENEILVIQPKRGVNWNSKNYSIYN